MSGFNFKRRKRKGCAEGKFLVTIRGEDHVSLQDECGVEGRVVNPRGDDSDRRGNYWDLIPIPLRSALTKEEGVEEKRETFAGRQRSLLGSE